MQILLNVVVLLLAIFGMIEVLRFWAVKLLTFKNAAEGVYVIVPADNEIEVSVRAAVEGIRWRAFEKRCGVVVISDGLSNESKKIVHCIARHEDNVRLFDYKQLEQHLKNMRLNDK